MPKYFNGISKICNKCKTEKPVSDFGKEKRIKHGLKSRCKKCCSAYEKSIYHLYRDKKIKRDAGRYIKKGAKRSKLTNTELRAIKMYRKLIYRLRISKTNTTEIMLGYSYKQLIAALGKVPELNENIDHKIPITWFINITDCKLINDLQNLQILTKTENSKKNNFYSHPVSFEYFEMVKDKLKPQYINKITHYGNRNN